MDEVFGSENFVSLIIFTKTSGVRRRTICADVTDYFSGMQGTEDIVKYRQLFCERIGAKTVR